jgi:hypothetical protein
MHCIYHHLCFDCVPYVCLIHRNIIGFVVMVQRNLRSRETCKVGRQVDRDIEENSEGRRERRRRTSRR